MLYLFQVTVYSALLYTVYLLVLKNRTSHAWNRFYLLLCATLPLVIPFIKIAGITTTIPVAANTLHILPAITISAQNKTHSVFTWSNIIVAAYVIIAGAILLRTIIQYIRFRRFVRANSYEVIGGTKVLLNTDMGPGSFQQYIFFPGSEIDDAIMQHEMAHIKLKHSNDILLMRLLQAIFWPNIVLYTITAELKIVHEFQADAYAVQNKDAYISTLLNDTFSTNNFSLSHTFFYHPLKRRIMMLQRSPLSRAKMRMAILQTGTMAILLLAGMVYLQSCKRQDVKPNITAPQPQPLDTAQIMRDAQQMAHEIFTDTMMKGLNAKKPETRAGWQISETEAAAAIKKSMLKALANKPQGAHEQNYTGVYTYVEKMPEPPYNYSAYVYSHIKYPESARKKGIGGRVIVRFTVNENGDIITPVILRSVDPDLDAEALRIVSSMPKWTPGEKDGKKVAVYFTLPIEFKLD